MEGLVFNIQRFSIHDGPGIRTTVFLKGCNLRCYWCHNPEALHAGAQLQVFPDKCIGCEQCISACPVGAHVRRHDSKLFHRELCRGCGLCAEVCYAGALERTGEDMSVHEVLAEVGKDRIFYENSGGGVTFSGGEALLQSEFLYATLVGCKEQGFHTVLDTAGNVPWEEMEKVLPVTDLFLYDIKVADPDKHKLATGVHNHRIMENLKRLSANDARVWVRIPVVPGLNDNSTEMEAIARLIAGRPGIDKVELMPFHRFGSGKYASLGMECCVSELTPPSQACVKDLIAVFRANGVEVIAEK